MPRPLERQVKNSQVCRIMQTAHMENRTHTMHASATVEIRCQTSLDVGMFGRSVCHKPEELPSYQVEIDVEIDKICELCYHCQMSSIKNCNMFTSRNNIQIQRGCTILR